jgi:uncharacterized protein YggE
MIKLNSHQLLVLMLIVAIAAKSIKKSQGENGIDISVSQLKDKKGIDVLGKSDKPRTDEIKGETEHLDGYPKFEKNEDDENELNEDKNDEKLYDRKDDDDFKHEDREDRKYKQLDEDENEEKPSHKANKHWHDDNDDDEDFDNKIKKLIDWDDNDGCNAKKQYKTKSRSCEYNKENCCNPVPSITVSGSAEVSLSTNIVIIGIAIQTDAQTAKDALEKNGALSDKVTSAINALSVSNDKISTSSFSVFPVHSEKPEDQNRIISWRVVNSIQVKVNDISLASKLIDAVVIAGATDILYVNFDVDPDNQNDVKTDLIRLAEKDALKKAIVSLKVIGYEICGIQSVNVNEYTSIKIKIN